MLKFVLGFSLYLIVQPNVFSQSKPIEPGVYHWEDFPVRKGTDRESRAIFEGSSPHFEYLEIHATTQMPGAKPRPAHANKDTEELVIIKEGKVRITIGDRSLVLSAGGVALILPQEMQAFENIGETNLTYYVFRYRSRKSIDLERGKINGGSFLLNRDSLKFKPSARGGGRSYFNRPTSMCENMEMHMTQLNKKGLSHTPHTHVESEIMLVLEGECLVTIEGKEYKATAGDFYFVNSGLLHAGGNGSDEPCSYLAFKWK